VTKENMPESETDDVRLRATEAQMRHALGLDANRPSHTTNNHSLPSTNGSHPQKRRFIRDGEVPVTVIHRNHALDGDAGVNQLDAARQALRSETAAKERVQRSLEEAQSSIHELQTKLAHERLAKDEALASVRRVAAEAQAAAQQTLQSMEAELEAERSARKSAEAARADALARCRKAEEQLREMVTAARSEAASNRSMPATAADTANDPGQPEKPVRRRGRPAKTGEPEADVVEWWVPGWQKKFR
jgi:septal ring factor EnvC (AmiA/AmiB activator)